MESILTSIKKLLGITEEYTHFDTDLIIHINSALGVLTQLGVGPEEGFIITGQYEKWNEFLSDTSKLELVKTYTYLKVKQMFDPPVSSAVAESVKRQIEEFEWRISVAASSD